MRGLFGAAGKGVLASPGRRGARPLNVTVRRR